MAAIQAAAEAAASLRRPWPRPTAPRTRRIVPRPWSPSPGRSPTSTEYAPSIDEQATDEPVRAFPTAEAAASRARRDRRRPRPGPRPTPEPEIDPRLAMLGLTPDFAAAEMAAAEAAAAEIDDVPEIGGRRPRGAPGRAGSRRAAGAGGPSVTTQVVVTGLVSVASIASFKRHIGRLAGRRPRGRLLRAGRRVPLRRGARPRDVAARPDPDAPRLRRPRGRAPATGSSTSARRIPQD